jgi:ribosomal protein S3AE
MLPSISKIITPKVYTTDFKEVVNKLILDSMVKRKDLPIHPLHIIFIRKVKALQFKFKLGKLVELCGEGSSSGKVCLLKANKLMDMNCTSKNLFKI